MPQLNGGTPQFRGSQPTAPIPPIPAEVRAAKPLYEQALELHGIEKPEPVTITNPDPPPTAKVVEVPVEVPTFNDDVDPEPQFDIPLEPKIDTPAADEVDEVEEITGTEDPEKFTTTIPTDNLKKLKTSHRDLKKNLKAIEAEKAALAEEVEKYRKGEIVPETLKELNDRVERLAIFEKIHNVKSSQAYQEQVEAPIQGLDTQLADIAKEVALPLDVLLEQAGKPRTELNAFLSDNFDSLTAQEVKDMLLKRSQLIEQRKQVEQQPDVYAERLKEHQEMIQVQRNNQRLQEFKETARNSYAETLATIRNEGKVLGVIRRTGDEHYNKTVVQPILQTASTEYGRLVKDLADSGLERLDPKLAGYLAKMTILAHASAVNGMEASAAATAYSNLNNRRDRLTPLLRPSATGTAPIVPPKAPEKRSISTQERSQEILNTVMTRR